MTCIEDKGERSGLYSNSVSNTTDTSPCHYEEIADFRRNPMTAFSLAHCGERVGMRGFTLAEVLIT
ncbi:hypothetical protein IJ732_04405, partial [bacterium]|nr:hypothetical protein [bacterium]